MTNQQPTGNQQLPATGNVAIYARVATQEKRTEKQTLPPHDLKNVANELGYDDSHIIVFEQDNGTSANKPMNERVGLTALMQTIASGTIHAVLIADETRLFRGVDAIQLQYFIHVCVEHHAIVYTPVATYDFTNPVHVKLFRFTCQQAFEMLQEAYKLMQRTRGK